MRDFLNELNPHQLGLLQAHADSLGVSLEVAVKVIVVTYLVVANAAPKPDKVVALKDRRAT